MIDVRLAFLDSPANDATVFIPTSDNFYNLRPIATSRCVSNAPIKWAVAIFLVSIPACRRAELRLFPSEPALQFFDFCSAMFTGKSNDRSRLLSALPSLGVLFCFFTGARAPNCPWLHRLKRSTTSPANTSDRSPQSFSSRFASFATATKRAVLLASVVSRKLLSAYFAYQRTRLPQRLPLCFQDCVARFSTENVQYRPLATKCLCCVVILAAATP